MEIEHFEKAIDCLKETITKEDGSIRDGVRIRVELSTGTKYTIGNGFGCNWHKDGMIFVYSNFGYDIAAFHVSSVVQVFVE